MTDDHMTDVNKFRRGSYAIPLDILEQKLLLHKGLIMITQGENWKAKQYFERCLNTGKSFCPRIRNECANQLRMILAAEGSPMNIRLEKLAESFRFRNRDFIFLVDQSHSMDYYKEQIIAIMTQIMCETEDCILNKDRVSLIKFSGRLRRIFSLVQKDSNFAQLKNQVEKLEFDRSAEQFGHLPKALMQAAYEFEKHSTGQDY